MSEPLKPNEDQTGEKWGTFFHRQFENLKIRTGLLQWEKFCERGEDGKAEARKLVAEMILECKRNPFDRVKKEVIQRIINSAVVDDKEFTGFSVRWIRHTLNAWWNLYGDKILRELQKAADELEEKNKPAPTVNPHEDVQQTVSNYIKTLLTENTGMQRVPHVDKAAAEILGAESKSNLEFRVAAEYVNPHSDAYYIMRDTIKSIASKFYKDLNISDFVKFKNFEVNSYKVFAANEDDAMKIYLEAEKEFNSRKKK